MGEEWSGLGGEEGRGGEAWAGWGEIKVCGGYKSVCEGGGVRAGKRRGPRDVNGGVRGKGGKTEPRDVWEAEGVS